MNDGILTAAKMRAAIQKLRDMPVINDRCTHPWLLGTRGRVPKQVIIYGKNFYQVCPVCVALIKI